MSRLFEPYYDVCTTHAGAVEAVETVLAQTQPGQQVRVSELLTKLPAGVFRDHVHAVLQSLVAAETLSLAPDGSYTVLAPAAEQAAVRVAIRHSCAWAATKFSSQRPTLLVAAPAVGAEQCGGIPFDHYFSDLRTAVRDLVASARSTLFLASPYWDPDVVADLAPLLERRLASGVDVKIMMRSAFRGSASAAALNLLRAVRVNDTSCSIRVLEDRSSLDPFGAATFHFKVACSDDVRAYVGSANFNTAGMSSRWELGLLLTGTHASRVCYLMDALFRTARSTVSV